jgi:hypothetical protein
MKVILMVGLVFVSGLEREGRTVATGELCWKKSNVNIISIPK